MTAKDMNRPAQCQVPGCDSTRQVAMHRETGVYACGKCRLRYRRNGHFGLWKRTPVPAACQVPGCGNTHKVGLHRATGVHACKRCRNRYTAHGQLEPLPPPPSTCQVEGCASTHDVGLHRATGVHACDACRKQYARTGEFSRHVIWKKRIGTPPICQVCRTRPSDSYSRVGNLPTKWRCKRCKGFAYRRGRERPLHTKYTRERVCVNCGRSTEYRRNSRFCGLCSSYRRRNGHLPDAAHIAKYAPHGWCECGKPAEVQIDLRTGGLLVVPTKTGMTDYLTGTREEYAEWVCRECAGYEDEMHRHGGNTYEPSSYIKRG